MGEVVTVISQQLARVCEGRGRPRGLCRKPASASEALAENPLTLVISED